METQSAEWKKNANTVLDVRPELARGGEPFVTIMEAASAISPGGTLVIVAPFEPVPLYGAMAERDFSHETEQASLNEWIVRFLKNSH